MYEVEITPEDLRHLNRLPEKVREAALAAILGPISENPQRLGKPLLGELEGLHSARRGDYRIIYEIFEDEENVLSPDPPRVAPPRRLSASIAHMPLAPGHPVV